MKAAVKETPPAQARNPMDAVSLEDVVALMLWKSRIQNPNLAITITDEDIKGLQDCLNYLKVKGEVHRFRSKNTLIVALVEKGSVNADEKSPTYNPTGNAITPVENNEKDFDRAQEAKNLQRLREQAPGLATQLRNDEAQGVLSKNTIHEAADALWALATGHM